MTVSSTISRSGPYSGNGVTKVFEYDFRILESTHLTVVRTVEGVDTVVNQSDYSVSGVGSDAGSIVLTIAPVDGESITIVRNAPFTQETDLQNQGEYYAEDVERAFDLAAMRDQQLEERLDRAVQIPVGANPSRLPDVVGNILRLAESADNIDIVADNVADVVVVSDNIGSVNIVGAIGDEVVIVAGIAGDVTTVAGISDDVSIVAEMSDSIPPLAERVLPVGGSAGQIPIKQSNGTTAWGNPPGGGDMVEDTYDPQGIADDAFNRGNHTGFASVGSTPGTILPSRAYAIASYHPVVGPDFITVAGYASASDGGGGLYLKAAAEPTHAGKFSISLVGGAVVWYELSRSQPVYAEMFGAIGHKTDAAALAGGAANSTAAILNAIAFLRSNGDAINDGLTNKTVTTYTSGVLNFGRGIFNISPNMIRNSQDLNLVWQGQGSRGKTNFARAATTILVVSTGSGFGVKAYGNGSRGFRTKDMDVCYTAGFTGNVMEIHGSPGSYPENCQIGTFGIRGGTRVQTARSGVSLAWDEFFNPKECVFDGSQYGIKIEDDNRLAVFTGSVSGNTLTVTAVASGELGTDVRLYDAGVQFAVITALGTGTGGTGTYTLNSSHTKTSRTLEADIHFGGSNSKIEDCVFYDIAIKGIEYRGGRRRTRQSIKDTIINPISMNLSIGIDLRNIDGLAIDNCDFVGSVANAPSVGWLWIENCTGSITSNMLGEGSLGATFTNSILDVTGNALNGIGGFVVNGGITAGKANEFLLTGGSGWNIQATGGAFLDLGPDWFNSNVTASYNIQPSSNAKGRIYRSIAHDFSQNGALNGAAAVTITSL